MIQVRINNETILSDEHYLLKSIDYDIRNKKGEWKSQKREVFSQGNAVTVLLYNPAKKTVLLARQFRMPTYVNGNSDGLLIEAPAGMLEEGEAPEAAIVREIKEETGYEVSAVEKVLEAYSSAGSLTEKIYYFVAAYSDAQKVAEGGGLEEEGEELTVMELSFAQAMSMIDKGEIIDAKTIILLQYAALKNLLS